MSIIIKFNEESPPLQTGIRASLAGFEDLNYDDVYL